MREAVIGGVGMHKMGRFPDKELEEIGRETVLRALEDANVPWSKVEAAFCGSVFGGMAIGHRVLARVGRTGLPIVNVENACASGGSALRLAAQAVAMGMYDIVLALGVEKMPRGYIDMSTFYDRWQVLSGLCVNPMYWALYARRYMEDYGLRPEHLGKISVKNHKYGALNPMAMYQKELTLDEVLNSRMVCDPLTLLMICAPNEGAAAAVLFSKSVARRYTTKPITVAAAVLSSPVYGAPEWGGTLRGISSTKIKNLDIVTSAAQQAYEISGCGAEDLDVVECADVSSWGEVQSYEQLSLCKEGEAPMLIDEGATEIGGRIPTNVSGGHLANGEALGASGLRQVAETVWELRGEAGPRQIADAKVGLCQVVGAGGNCCVVILKR